MSSRPTGPLDSDAEMDGPALETLVLQELRAINNYLECGYKIYFWRTRNQLEIERGVHIWCSHSVVLIVDAYVTIL